MRRQAHLSRLVLQLEVYWQPPQVERAWFRQVQVDLLLGFAKRCLQIRFAVIQFSAGKAQLSGVPVPDAICPLA